MALALVMSLGNSIAAEKGQEERLGIRVPTWMVFEQILLALKIESITNLCSLGIATKEVKSCRKCGCLHPSGVVISHQDRSQVSPLYQDPLAMGPAYIDTSK